MSAATTHYFRKRSPTAKAKARAQRKAQLRQGMKVRRRARRQQRRKRRALGGPLTVEQIRRMLGSGAIARPTLARALGARGVTAVIVNPASRRRASMAKRRRRRRGRITGRRSWPVRRRRRTRGGRRRIVRRRRNPALGFLLRNPGTASKRKSSGGRRGPQKIAPAAQGSFAFAEAPAAAKINKQWRAAMAGAGVANDVSAAEGRRAAEQATKAAAAAADASHDAFREFKAVPHKAFEDVFGTGLNKEEMRAHLDPFGTGFSQELWDQLRFREAPFGMSKAQIYEAKKAGTYRPWMEFAKPPAWLRQKAAKLKKAATAAKADAKKAKKAATKAVKAAAKVQKSKAPPAVKAKAKKAAKKAAKAAVAAETTAKAVQKAATKVKAAAKQAKKAPAGTMPSGKRPKWGGATGMAMAHSSRGEAKAHAGRGAKTKGRKGRKGKAKSKGKKAAARRPAASTKRKGDRVMVKRDKGGRRVKRVSVVLKNPSLGSIKAMAKQTAAVAVPSMAGGALMGLIDAKILAGRHIGMRVLGKLIAAGGVLVLLRKYPRSATATAGAMLGTLGYELLTRFAGGFMAPSKEEVKKELGALVREDPYALQGLIDSSGVAYSQFPSLQGGTQYWPDEVHTG